MSDAGRSKSWTDQILGRILWYWMPVVAWMGAIFWFSSQPHLPIYPDRLIDLLMKKLGHLTGYAVLAMLSYRAWAGRGTRAPSPLPPWALAVAYAFSDEYHQLFVPGRDGNLYDVALDSFGAAVGLALLMWWRTRLRGRNEDGAEKAFLVDSDAATLHKLEDGKEGDDDLHS